MPTQSKNELLRARVLQQLEGLQEVILELLDDAEAGRAIRAMFEARTQRAANGIQPTKERAARKATPKKKAEAASSTAADAPKSARVRPESNELAEKILSVLSEAKKGLKVRELRERLPDVKAGSLTYQLEKLLDAKKIRKRGKTSKTTYLLAPA